MLTVSQALALRYIKKDKMRIADLIWYQTCFYYSSYDIIFLKENINIDKVVKSDADFL